MVRERNNNFNVIEGKRRRKHKSGEPYTTYPKRYHVDENGNYPDWVPEEYCDAVHDSPRLRALMISNPNYRLTDTQKRNIEAYVKSLNEQVLPLPYKIARNITSDYVTMWIYSNSIYYKELMDKALSEQLSESKKRVDEKTAELLKEVTVDAFAKRYRT